MSRAEVVMRERITFRDSFVNTIRVRHVSQSVKNSTMDFRRALKHYRTDANLTQEQLAHACGWNGQSRIANYEADPSKSSAREPKLSEISKIAKALKISEAQLLGLDQQASLDAAEMRLLEAHRVADSDGKRILEQTSEMILRMANAMQNGKLQKAS